MDIDESMSFRRYEVKIGTLEFQVVGVWTWATETSATSYRQAHEGLTRHRDWITQGQTVILGDFNGNEIFKGGNWQDLRALMQSLGLVSAYHHYYSQPFGTESTPTHYHLGKEEKRFHLDYCFIPEAWVGRIQRVDVGSYEDWRHISDHVPLVVDLDLGESQ